MSEHVTATITITLTVTDDDVIHRCETDDGAGGEVPMVEALGMLRMAEDSLLHGPEDGADDD